MTEEESKDDYSERAVRALEALVVAYRERTKFFVDSTPGILKASAPPPGFGDLVEQTQDLLASAGVARPKVRIKKTED